MQSTLYQSILQKGEDRGRRQVRAMLLALCEAMSIAVNDARRAQIEAMDLDQLSALRRHLMSHRAWPV